MTDQPYIDLTRVHFQRTIRYPVVGWVTIYGTWIHEGTRHTPCLAIIRGGEQLHQDTQPCIVPLSTAWIWHPPTAGPEGARMAASAAYGFAQALRLDHHNAKTVMRIGMMIDDNLGDLITIPPYRAEKSDVVAEITVTHKDLGTVKEVEVRDDV